MSLPPPVKVEKLQAALHSKAKRAPSYRFYALYDKILRRDVLWFAHRRCLINGGAPGVDGVTFDDIEAYGEERWRTIWRTISETRRIVLRQFVECGFQSRAVPRNAHWAFLQSEIASFRWRSF